MRTAEGTARDATAQNAAAPAARVLRERRIALALGAALIAYALLFYRELLFERQIAVFRDQYTIVLAMDWVVRLLSQWEWPPLWTPFQVLGKPLAADPLAGVFYPPNWLLRRLPFPLGYNASLALHHALAAAGMYALLRARRVAAGPAAFGGLLFGFGGLFVAFDNMLNAVQSSTWLPWTLLAFDRWCAARRRAALAGTAAGIALTLLGGMPEVFFFEVALCAALALDHRVPPWRALGAASVAIALGIGLAAVQLVPTAEYLLHSSRAGGLALDGVMRLALRPLGVLAFLLPRRYVDPSGSFHETAALWDGDYSDAPWAISLYLGPILVLAAALHRGARTWLWGAVGLAFLLLALGERLPGYREALIAVPLLRAARHPEKFLLVVHALLAVAAAGGLDAACRAPARFRRIAIAALGLAAIAAIAAGAVALRPSFARTLLVRDLATMMALLIAIAAAAWYGRRRPQAALALLALLTAVDLYRVNAHLVPTVDWGMLREPPAAVRAMPRGEDPLRIYSDGLGRPAVPSFPDAFLQERNLLLMEIANYFAIANLNAPASINLRDHEELAVLTESVPRERLAGLFGAFNTAWVTSPKDLHRYPGLTPVLTPQTPVDAYLYRVEPIAPRAYVPRTIEPLRRAEDAIDYLRTAPDPAGRVGLAAGDVPLGGIPEHMTGSVRLTGYRASEVELEAEMETNGLVVLTDTFYPGWEAEIDGAPTPIVRANYFVRGVFVPAGTHRIVFRYRPQSQRNGWILSAISAAAVLALVAWRGPSRPSVTQ